MICEGCYEKQVKIDKLQEEVERLRHKLYAEERKTKDGYFGSSTPSSKKPFKKTTQNQDENKNGGAVQGHKGAGRKKIEKENADKIEIIESEICECPYCKNELMNKGFKQRNAVDRVETKIEKIIYNVEQKYCPHCKKTFKKKPPLLPKSLYGNQFIADALTMHYKHGIPVGRIVSMFESSLSDGVFFEIAKRISKILSPAIPHIINDYRKEKVKQADETSWYIDGKSGYAWIFCGKKTTIFEFANSRSSEIPRKILGTEKLNGFLVVDRYAGYNKINCSIQYCYSHLDRNIEDFGKEFLNNKEVQNFVSTLRPLLCSAIKLRNKNISDKLFYSKAATLKNKIIAVVNSPAQHLGIQNFQTIFKKYEHRLYHWATDRDVPADNNKSERELRPSVIARKVSFGSQSAKGAETRSVIMTFLETANKRLGPKKSLVGWFKNILDNIAANPDIDVYKLLPT